MLQNETHERLTREQVIVLEALLAGNTITSAAERGNVSRSTVHRWLKLDHDFVAAFNGGQRELAEAVRHRLLKIARAATDVVERAIEGGDVKVALSVLKGVGALSGESPEIGSADPAELADDAEYEAAEAAYSRMLLGALLVT